MTQWAQPPQRREQLVLFAQRLDQALPAEHSVRLLDDILTQLDWSAWEAKYHLSRGQPAIHPRVLAGVLLYGLLTRIRSSRGLAGQKSDEDEGVVHEMASLLVIQY